MFVAPSSSVEMEKMCKGFVPKNTQRLLTGRLESV